MQLASRQESHTLADNSTIGALTALVAAKQFSGSFPEKGLIWLSAIIVANGRVRQIGNAASHFNRRRHFQ
jgi:hypothetical protein